ncbi:hypothetical protein THRCLA_06908 [Thraustotheca clavata]|uniref:Calmodulin n=1 Tax=Thraustotheca clavata TaxID=74557 RepID=A0A1V9ZHV0_9STRA|nr:hypothetical protein THRCLA_06908 [Thraustotheca clavata]
MNIADLRKFKDRAKGKTKRKRAIDSSTDSNISDAEYYSKTKIALRTAFDFFDIDCSNSIDIEELGHVLLAVGDEVTVDELNQIMQQIDLDASGQIEFEEFYLLMKERMSSKRVEFRAKTELELRAIFDQMDTDHNGMLDADEFHYALVKQLQIPLTKDEFYAVLDEADTSNDDQIDIDEFTQFMLLIADASRQDDTLENLSSIARSAIKKIARGAPLDPEAQLLSLLGVPTNFRPSITSAAVRLKKHTMEYVLSFPPPDTVYNMAQQGNLAVPPTQTQQEKWAQVENSESKQCQAIVSLKFAKGVPSPYDKRERDVVERKVRVCFFDMSDVSNTITAAGCRRSDGQIIGNIHEIPVACSKKEEDVWNFSKASTNCDDYKFIMRTNMPMDDLFLLIEFIVVLKSISAHEMRQVTVKTKYKVPPPLSAQRSVEMTCCWAKIPLTQLVSKTKQEVIRFDVPLFGGTFLNPVELDEDEILRRRSGWRALAKAFKQYTPPQLQIKSLQISNLPLQDKLCISELPSTIVAPYSSVPIIQDYMALMKSVISTLDNPSHVYTCEPALKLFPRILDNDEVYEVFRNAFNEEMRSSFKTPADRQKKFKDLVLRMWPAFVMPKSRIEIVDEVKEEDQMNGNKLEQTKRLSSMAKGKYSLKDVKEPSIPFHVREVSFERLL